MADEMVVCQWNKKPHKRIRAEQDPHGACVNPVPLPGFDPIMDSARKIVNYVLEKAEVSVDKRQQINDFCDAYARQEIEDLIEEMP